jgi:hypothetical protein
MFEDVDSIKECVHIEILGEVLLMSITFMLLCIGFYEVRYTGRKRNNV